MAEEKYCPGCGRHCNLENPHCGRGETYRRTGELPEREYREEHAGEDGESCGRECRHGEGELWGKGEHHEEGHFHGERHHDGEEYPHRGQHYNEEENPCGEEHECREKRHREARMLHYQAADENEKLIINLRDLGHMMRSQYEGKASQRRILIILSEEKTITQRDLTERLSVQPGSASEILSKLESAGLICRTQNETDRRTTDVTLTDEGRELAAQALAQRQKRHTEMFSCLSGEEKQELLSLLEKVSADWRERYRGSGHGPHERHGHHGECGPHGEHGHRGEHGPHGEHGYHGEHGHHGEHSPHSRGGR